MTVTDETQNVTRESILAELKEVYETMTINQAKEFQRRWRRIDSWESAYEEEMNDQFYEMINHVFSKQKEELALNASTKEELVKKAEALMEHASFNEATKISNELMEEWKKAKSAGRDLDDALWQKFNDARQAFFNKKQQYFTDRKEASEKARELKEALIEEVISLKNSTEFKKTSDRLNEIMNLWKSARSITKEVDDQLWEKFNTERQVFYDNRKEYYLKVEAENQVNYEAKSAILAKIQEIVNANYYSKENTAMVKQLVEEFKKIGFAGKVQENECWTSFKSLTDTYFAGLKAYSERKAEEYLQRKEDRKSFLLNKIEQEKRMIERIKRDIVGTLAERAVRDMEEDIQERLEYIAEIEEDLKAMD